MLYTFSSKQCELGGAVYLHWLIVIDKLLLMNLFNLFFKSFREPQATYHNFIPPIFPKAKCA